jgi:hypothetical protein
VIGKGFKRAFKNTALTKTRKTDNVNDTELWIKIEILEIKSTFHFYTTFAIFCIRGHPYNT